MTKSIRTLKLLTGVDGATKSIRTLKLLTGVDGATKSIRTLKLLTWSRWCDQVYKNTETLDLE